MILADNVQPIETAPKDGTVILTNCGFARYVDPTMWASPVARGWAECDPFGNIYECVENGFWYCQPLHWSVIPKWLLPTK